MRVCSFRDLTLASCQTFQEVLEPQFVLVLAWALGHVVKDVQTAEYLSGALETGIPAYLLPALITVSEGNAPPLTQTTSLLCPGGRWILHRYT